MSNVNLNPLRSGASPGAVVTHAPPPVGVPTTPDRAPEHAVASPRPFAELLRQSRSQGDGASTGAAAAAPAPAPRENEAVDASDADDAPASATNPANPSAANRKPRAPASTGAKSAPAKRSDGTPADGADSVRRDDLTATPGSGSGTSTATATWQATDTLATPTTAVDDSAHGARLGVGATDGDASAEAARASDTRSIAADAHRARQIDSTDTERTALIDSAREIGSKTAAPAFLAALADGARPAADAQATRESRSDALAAAVAAGTTSASAAPARIEAPVGQVTLATPFDAADFASALGVQVTLLAQNGVQHAELRLNPAEMGPVSIHIALDGSAAHVDFGADLAATRDAIERGLPELAAALRDAGFTLAGGGVSQHADQRPADERDAARPGRRLAGIEAPSRAVSATQVVRRVATGGVDLYA